jgi:hypothetical protein
MKITLESTTKMVTLVVNGRNVPARLWEGTTERGIPVHAFITRIGPTIPEAELTAEQDAEFQRDLQQQKAPSPGMEVYDMRFFID